MRVRFRSALVVWAISSAACCGLARGEAVAVFSGTGPDAAAYGADLGYPVGPRTAQVPQVDMVGHYSHYDEKYPRHLIAKSGTPSVLRRAPEELALTYRYQNASYSL
jgi:hypothetical protein